MSYGQDYRERVEDPSYQPYWSQRYAASSEPTHPQPDWPSAQTQLLDHEYGTLEREFAAEKGGKAALVAQLEAAGRQQAALETALADARRDFAVELEKLRQALHKSEERYEAAEKRALLEIERERTAAAKAQKDVAQARKNQQDVEQRHRIEMAKLQADLGGARQNVGVAEGMLYEMRTQCQQKAEELQSLRLIIAECETRNSLLERDLSASRDKLAKVENELQQWPAQTPEHASAKPRKSTRRTAT